ncbi:MAG: hypothetical protein V1781_02635 [Bacteroidota bacterium]
MNESYTYTIEKQIDVMVYKLYELTDEETKIIETEFVLIKKEYETKKRKN